MRTAALFLLLFLAALPSTVAGQGKNALTISAQADGPHSPLVMPLTAVSPPPVQQPNGAPVEPRPWWLGDLLTLFGIFVGAFVVVWQLGRQHKQAMELQKENAREQLRLQVYQEFAPVLVDASDKAINAGTYVALMAINMHAYSVQCARGLKPAPLKERAIEFCRRHHDAANEIVKIIRLIEKYQVVTHDLEIFQLALNVASHDLRETFSPLYESMLAILPMDILTPNGTQAMNVICPTSQHIQDFETLTSAYVAAKDDFEGYLFDLNVELQNIFLSNLFNNRVLRRKPISPIVKVISTDKEAVDELRKYFEEETPWGLNKSRIEREVRATLEVP